MKKIISVLLLCAMLVSIGTSLIGCDLIKGLVGDGNTAGENGDQEGTKDPEGDSELPIEETKEEKYISAIALLDEKKYEEAYAIFNELGDYKDCAKYLSRFYYALTSRTSTTTYDGTVSVNTLRVEFDSNNLPIAYVHLWDGNEHSDSYEYDERGNLTKETIYIGGGDHFICEYTYDENNKLIKEVNSSTYDSAVTVTEYYYDENGLLIQTVIPRENGTNSCTDYTYDENGKLIKTAFSDTFGFEVVYEYSYNEDGLLSQYVYTSFFANEIYNVYYTEDGKILKETYSDGEEVVMVYDYIYDANGNLIKKISQEGEYTTVNEYSYDELGNPVKEVETFADSAPCVYEYEYKFVYIPFDLSDKVVDLLTYQAE